MLRMNALGSTSAARVSRTRCQAVDARANRRHILVGSGTGLLLSLSGGKVSAAETFTVAHTDAEWRTQLGPAAYNVLRKQGTERPRSSPLAYEERVGTYSCDGCGKPLFRSDTKFESGTGWPSFFDPIPGATSEAQDTSMLGPGVWGVMFVPRVEVHCADCGGHLGHVFDDGPKPTGKRYCMNGVAMTFKPDANASTVPSA